MAPNRHSATLAIEAGGGITFWTIPGLKAKLPDTSSPAKDAAGGNLDPPIETYPHPVQAAFP